MKVIVIGGGVVGVASAYYLCRSGAEVVLLEKNDGPALETSFANAGSMTASRAGPWASPKALAKTLKGYFSEDSAFKLHLCPDLEQYRWLAGFVVTAFSDSRVAKRSAMVKLGLASLRERRRLDQELALSYGVIRPRLLTIYDNVRDLDAAVADLRYLQGLGVTARAMSPADCRSEEPNVAWDRLTVVGGILAIDDETADCHEFSKALATVNQRVGVDLRYGECVRKIDAKSFGNCTVTTDVGVLSADAVLIAAGISSVELAKAQGIKLPIFPVKGYSISIDMPLADRPQVTISDERRKVFVAPTESGVRGAGVADIVGYQRDITASRIALIERRLKHLFPKANLDGDVSTWAGLRAMTHDGPPIICGMPGSGLWFNTGHGSLGWTFACGAADVVAKLLLNRSYEPENRYFGLSHRWFS